MCGIICGISKGSNIFPFLLEGIKNLEYRGYDSFGCAYLDENNEMVIKKDKGTISTITNKYKLDNVVSSCGICHTRWATHGNVSKKNSHPLTDCTGNIAVVHNGIIENYKELKSKLINHKLVSDTDTEIIAHLIEEGLKTNNDLENVVKGVFDTIKGYSSFAVLINGSKKIIGIKNGSPLIFAIADNKYFISSDVPSILNYTNRIVYLFDGDMVVFDENGYRITNLMNKKVKHEVVTVDIDPTKVDKGIYKHYMLKEILEQQKILHDYETYDFSKVKEAADIIKEARKAYVIGSGSSFHAAVYGAKLLRSVGIDSYAIRPNDYNDFEKIITDKDVFIIISQSGETADIIKMLPYIEKNTKIGIINVEGSHLSANVDILIKMNVGVEKAVAATKSFTSSLVLLKFISSYIEHQENEGIKYLKKLNIDMFNLFVPSVYDHIKRVAKVLSKNNDIYFTGVDYGYIASLESALKMKEVSYLHAEAIESFTFKHGTLALINKKSYVVSLYSKDNFDDIANSLDEIRSRGGNIICIGENKLNDKDSLIRTVPSKYFEYIPHIIATQLLAYYTAIERGNDPDKPRNLAKSVTVR
ncbi:MAG: glutamine--fructose-6-phosphate transaminase (isomerizing) [Thermoplasmata archaeon]